jgi:low temperature requirement protein LtrA
VIIALGESIILTGATFSDGEMTSRRSAAFVAAFLGSVAFWWIFHLDATRLSAAEAIERNVGGFGRVFSYTVIVLILGIIVSAVGDELVIGHPGGHTETAWLLVIFGGPALFLAGGLLVQATTIGRIAWSSVIGLGLLAILAPLMSEASPLAAAISATAVLVGIAVWETVWEWARLAKVVNRPVITGD